MVRLVVFTITSIIIVMVAYGVKPFDGEENQAVLNMQKNRVWYVSLALFIFVGNLIVYFG